MEVKQVDFTRFYFSFYERKVSYRSMSVTQINGLILLRDNWNKVKNIRNR